MRCAFICWRPYQVINAINMVLNDIEETSKCSDLFLQNISSLLPIYEKISNLGIFENVYLFNEQNRGDGTGITKTQMAKIYLKKTFDFVFPKCAVKNHCKGIKQYKNYYDVILSSGWISFNTEMMNCNPNARCILFEDGFANYISDNLDMIPRIQKVYFKILNALGKGFYSIKIKKMYVYEPELVNVRYEYPIFRLPKISNACKEILLELFNVDNKLIYTKNSIVYLDQPLKEQKKDFDLESLMRRLSQMETFIYRKHPLQQSKGKYLIEDNSGIAWEVIGSVFSKESFLVSPYSTALVTPYLIYGHCPKLLFLYKLCLPDASNVVALMDEFMNKLREKYNNSIYIPETTDELNTILDLMEENHV